MIPDRNQLKKGKIYFGSQFPRFHPVVTWPHCFCGPVARQIFMMERAWLRKSGYLMAAEEQEREKVTMRTRHKTFQGHFQGSTQ
jgi:hypothetical protein